GRPAGLGRPARADRLTARRAAVIEWEVPRGSSREQWAAGWRILSGPNRVLLIKPRRQPVLLLDLPSASLSDEIRSLLAAIVPEDSSIESEHSVRGHGD